MPKIDSGITIEELAREAGVSLRTVRYYISEGLLPNPVGRGKGAAYGEEHRLRLRAIKLLSEQRVPLIEIRERLSKLTSNDIRALLAEQDQFLQELRRAASALTPKEYLSALLKRSRQGPSKTVAFDRQNEGIPCEASATSLPLRPREQIPSQPAFPQARRAQAAGLWHRWEIEPGVELSVRSDVVDRYWKLIDILRIAAGQIEAEDLR